MTPTEPQPAQPSANSANQPSRRALRPSKNGPQQPLSRRELRAREQALQSGALLLDPSGQIQVNPERQAELDRPPVELEQLHTGAVLPDGTVLTRRLMRELRQAAQQGEADALNALSEFSALTATSAPTSMSASSGASAVSGSSAVSSATPTSAPSASSPEPSAPTPEPSAPTPEPSAPTPEPSAATPEPAASSSLRSRRLLRAAQSEASAHTGASFDYPMLHPPLQAQAMRDVDESGDLGPIQDLSRKFEDHQEELAEQHLPGYSDDYASSTLIPAITGQLSAYEPVDGPASAPTPAPSPELSPISPAAPPVRASVLGQQEVRDPASVPTPVRSPQVEDHAPSGADPEEQLDDPAGDSDVEHDRNDHDHHDHDHDDPTDNDDVDASFDAPVTWKPLEIPAQSPELKGDAPLGSEDKGSAAGASSKNPAKPKQNRADVPSTPKLLKGLQWVVILLAVAVLALLVYVLATQDEPLFSSAVAVGWDIELMFSQFAQGDV